MKGNIVGMPKSLAMLSVFLMLSSLGLSGDEEIRKEPVSVEELEIAANDGSAYAAAILGVKYSEGAGIDPDQTKAFYWFKRSAQMSGQSEIQFEVGRRLRFGDGVDRDRQAATSWFQKAADQGHIRAQYSLASMYRWGDGIPQDHSKAFVLFQNAANQGLREAQFSLGQAYFHGQGVPQNYSKAFEWTSKAAEQDLPLAQSMLGLFYGAGKGTDRDYVEAHKWTNLAAASGHEQSASMRLRFEKQMTPEQIAEAQRLATEWRQTYDKRRKTE